MHILFKKLFFRKLTNEEKGIQIIRKMGYKKVSPTSFERESGNSVSIITIRGKSIVIKSYFNGISETEYLDDAFQNKENLIEFIRYNQV